MKLHKRFIKSLYSTSSMSQFRLFGVGSTIMYVLLLTFICMLPIVLIFLMNLFSANGSQSLTNFQNYGLDQEQMQHFASSMDGIMPILLMVVYISMYILFAGILFSGVSVISVIGIFLSKVLRKNLNYRHLWVICCYSITLPVVLMTILFASNVQLPFSFLLFWILSCIIFAFSIVHAPAKK